MKKWISLLLVLVLLAATTVTACAEDAGDALPAENHETVFDIGTNIGSWYTNEFLNLMINLDGWTIGDEETLKNAMGSAEEYLDESVLEALENSSPAYLLYAIRPIERKNHGDETIQITMEKAPENRGVKYTAKQIRDASGKKLRASLKSAGWKVEQLDSAEIPFAGRVLPGFHVAASFGRFHMYETIALEVVNDYAVTYTFTSDEEAKLEESLERTFPYSVSETEGEEKGETTEGEWHRACSQFELCVPKGWTELSKVEGDESGICFAMQDDTGKTKLELKHYDAAEAEKQFGASGREALEIILEKGAERSFFALVNGMESVCCYEEESSMLAATFLDVAEEGALWVLAFSPIPDQRFFETDMDIIGSVKPA